MYKVLHVHRMLAGFQNYKDCKQFEMLMAISPKAWLTKENTMTMIKNVPSTQACIQEEQESPEWPEFRLPSL